MTADRFNLNEKCSKSGSFGRASCCSCPNIVFTMVLPVGFVCAEVGFVCAKCQRRSRSRTKPVSSAQDRRHNNLLTSRAKNKARRSKPHRALITALKDALLCMSPASFASKTCSAVARCSSAKLQHSATEYLRPEIAVAVAASPVRAIQAGSRRSPTMIYGWSMSRRPHVLEKPRRAQPCLAPRCPVR